MSFRPNHAAVISLLALVGCTVVERPPSDNSELEQTPAQPVPGSLQEVMVGLATNMDTVHAGLWAEDMAQVERAATLIAGHPQVSAAERTRIQQALGADFPQFVAGDKRVHDAAVELAAAATADDIAEVLRALERLERGCVSCHSGFRARVAK